MDLNTIIRSDNADRIQLVVNAADLRDLLDTAMAFAKQEIKERDEPTYYTQQEMCKLLHVSQTTLIKYRSKGIIPQPITIDGKCHYNKADVREALNRLKH